MVVIAVVTTEEVVATVNFKRVTVVASFNFMQVLPFQHLPLAWLAALPIQLRKKIYITLEIITTRKSPSLME